MDYQIRWSLKSADNLEAICDFIAIDSPYYASLTAQKILALVDNIKIYPESGRIVPEFNNPEIRELIYKSYRIIYRFKENIIEIVTISHSARKEIKLD